jgi:hypothetical protein
MYYNIIKFTTSIISYARACRARSHLVETN